MSSKSRPSRIWRIPVSISRRRRKAPGAPPGKGNSGGSGSWRKVGLPECRQRRRKLSLPARSLGLPSGPGPAGSLPRVQTAIGSAKRPLAPGRAVRYGGQAGLAGG